MNQKKILFLIDDWQIGGREKVVKNLLENLTKDNNEYKLIIFKKVKKHISFAVCSYPRDTQIIKTERKYYSSILLWLIKLFLKEKPDAIVTHTTYLMLMFVQTAKLISKIILLKKIKIIIVHHMFYELGWKIYHPVESLFLKYFHQHSDCIICVSDGLRDYIKNLYNIPNDKIKRIYNPIIDSSAFGKNYSVPQEFNNFHEIPKILTVCRLNTKEKDFETLIRAFNLVNKKIPSLLYIIGEGQRKKEIQELVKKFNLVDKAVLLGARDNPYPYFANSSVFVLSSITEGLPTVLVEAMAHGCPVVSTDCPFGPKELIKDNENGILVPMKNPEKMAEAIINILNNKILAKKLITNGLLKAKEFDVQNAIAEYENTMNSLFIQNK